MISFSSLRQLAGNDAEKSSASKSSTPAPSRQTPPPSNSSAPSLPSTSSPSPIMGPPTARSDTSTLTVWFAIIDAAGVSQGEARAVLTSPNTTVYDLCREAKSVCPNTILCDPNQLSVTDASNTRVPFREDISSRPRSEVLSLHLPQVSHDRDTISIAGTELSMSQLSEMLARSSTGPAAQGAVLWVPDHLRPTCQPCGSNFSMFKRRHHCRRCGGVFCSACSSKQVLIAGLLRRVCDHCYEDVARSGVQAVSSEEAENNGTLSLTLPTSNPSRPVGVSGSAPSSPALLPSTTPPSQE